MNIKLVFGALGAIVLIGLGAWLVVSIPGSVPPVVVAPVENQYADLIKVDSLVANATVTSPLVVTGEARGSWYFEASFPIELQDANGNRLLAVPAQAQGEWMTENFVPFKATLIYDTPTTPTGTLVVKNDNPSGNPENSKEVRIPVKFSDYKEIKKAEFGKPVTLALGERVSFSDGYYLSLKEINDSRCKQGVQCIWAGELAAVFSAGNLSSSALPYELRLGTVNNKSVSLRGYNLVLESATVNSVVVIVSVVAPPAITTGVSGYVHMGPTCPVEKNPPDPNCADKPFVGADVRVELWPSGVLATNLVTDAIGKFQVSLAAGRYTIVVGPKNGASLPRCQTVGAIVAANQVQEVDVSCDTGIR